VFTPLDTSLKERCQASWNFTAHCTTWAEMFHYIDFKTC